MQALFFFINSSIEFIQLFFKAILGLRGTYFFKSPKAFLIILTLTLGNNAQAQDTIFYENMGASATTVSVASYTGWRTGTSYIMTGNANIVHTATPFSTTTDYSQASGNAPIVFNSQSVGLPREYWEISGINSTCYSSVSLRIGIYKQRNDATGANFAVEYSTDGVSYSPLAYTLPSGGGTTGWYAYTLTGLVASPNLRIRFTNNSTLAGDNYRLDDISLRGTVSSAKPTLTFDNNTIFSCGSARLTAATGGLTKSVKLDGVNDHISFGSTDYFNNTGYTVELWANIKAYEPNMKIFDFGNGTPADNVMIHFPSDAAGKLRFSIHEGSTPSSVTSTTAFPFNRWVHIACVFDGTTGYIYLDGVLNASGPIINPFTNFALFNNYVGKSGVNAGDPYPEMEVDEIRIWSIAKSAAQIQAEMDVQIASGTTGLRDYWRLDEGSGTSTADPTGGRVGTLTGGANWSATSAPIGVTYSWSPATSLSSTTARSVVSTTASSLWYTVTATYSNGCTNTGRVFVNTIVPGDPTVYGNGEWISYAYSGAGTTYSGYYKESSVSFDSRNKWDRVLSPSSAPGYQGCVVDAETHTVSYKRTNFTPGVYQFVFEANDETAHLFIDEVSKYSRSNSTTSETVWIGSLTSTSKVHYRWRETGGSSYGQLTITAIAQPTLNPGVVAGNQTICYNGDPAAFTSTTAATGCSEITYLWQFSPDNSNWTDIGGATSATYDPGVLTSTTYYRRKVTNACNAVNYSNVLTVTITNPGTPSVTPGSRCGVGTVNLSASGSPGTYNWYAASTGGASLGTTANFTTPVLSTTTTYYVSSANAGCDGPRTAVVATINHNPSVAFASTSINGCPSATLTALGHDASNIIRLDGVDDHIQVPDAVWFSGNFTFEGWVFARTRDSWSRLFDFGTADLSNNVYLALSEGTTGKLIFRIYTAAGVETSVTTSSAIVPLNEWVHIACTYNAGIGTIYLNGVSVASGPMTAPNSITRTKCYIGKSNFPGDAHSNIDVDEIRIWNVARTAAEIQSGFAGVSTSSPGLLAFWRIQEGAGTTTTDSKSGLIANLINGPTWAVPAAAVGETYTWAPSTGLSATTGKTVTALHNANITYTVTARSFANCTATASIDYIAGPVSPTGVAGSRCGTGTVDLSAFGSPGTYAWYDVASGGSVLATTANFTTPAISATKTYYVASVVAGCESVRTAVIATVVSSVSNLVSFDKDTIYGCSGAKLVALGQGMKNAIRLDGVNDYLTVPANTYFNGNFTVEAWVNAKSYSNFNRLFDFGNGAASDNVYLSLSETTTGRISLSVYQGGTGTNVGSNTILPLNQWVHIACVLNGTTATIYMNGENVGSGPLSIPNNVVRNQCYIGRSNWGSDAYSNSDLDEFRIWNVARTQAEIQAGMETQIPLGSTGLTHYWKMTEGSGTTTVDAKSGVIATLQNGAAWITNSAPLDLSYSWNPTTGLSPASGRILTATPAANTKYVVTALAPNGCSTKDSIIVIPSTPPGNPAVFGNGSWNVSATDAGTYLGYYTEPSLSFHSHNKWNYYFSPSHASDYKGCLVPSDNHAVSYKRTNIAAGIYKIEFNRNDDSATILIDGNVKFGRPYRTTTETAWIGAITPASQIEYKWLDYTGRSEGQITFTIVAQPPLDPGDITGDQTICYSADPVALTSSAAATGCSNLRYQWQYSTDNSIWKNILGATALTYDPGSLTVTTYYRRTVTDDCNASSNSDVITVTVSNPTAPGGVNGSNCGTGTVNLSATGSPATYRWYDVSTGGSSLASTSGFTTPSISVTTLYYVSSVDAAGCEGTARTTVTATIHTVPAAPGKTDGARCGTGTVALSASGSPATYNWYNVSSGGSSLATTANYTTPSISITTLYYVSAVSAQSCESPRTTVTATINTIPAAPGKTDGSRCGTGTVDLSASGSPATYNWYNVSSGGSSLATTANFTTPSISVTTLYYVSAVSAQNCEGPRTTVTATVNTVPTAPGKTDGARCGSGTVNLSANGSPSTYNWYDVSSGGSSLATTANFTTPSISITTLYYVGAVSAQNCEGPRTTVTATVNSGPAAPGKTDGERCGTGTVNLSANGSSASYNWYDVPTGGSSLATTANFTTPSISVTTLYYVSAVNAQGCEGPRTTVTATINTIPAAPGKTDGARCGTGTVELAASGSPATYNWYNVSSGGSSLATTTNYTTPSISTTTLYYVSAVSAQSCEGPRTTVTATINPIPAAPTTVDGQRCGPGTVTFSASGSPGTYRWYDVPSGGVPIGTDPTYGPTFVSADKIFYVSAVSAANCEGPRASLTIFVLPVPTAPIGIDSFSCGAGAVTLKASGSPDTYKWYNISSGGVVLGTSSTFVTPSINATTPFYVSAVSVQNCEGPRTTVTATIITPPAAPNGIVGSNCGTGTVNLSADGSPSTYKWYDVSSGGSSLATTANFTTPSISATKDYFVSSVDALGCEGARATVTATIHAIPSAPSKADGFKCGPGTVNLSAAGSTGTYNWYDVSTGGPSLAITSSFTTPSISATTPYYVSAVSAENCEGPRTTVTAEIRSVPANPTVINDTVCVSGTATLTASGSPGGYKWYPSLTTEIALETLPTYSPFVNATTVYYVASENNGCESTRITATAFVSSPSDAGTISGAQTVCQSANSGVVQLTGYSGTIQKWEISNDGFVSDKSMLAGTSDQQSYNNLTQTSHYRAIIKSGVCPADTSSIVIITTEAPAIPGSLSGDANVPGGINSGSMSLAGHSGTIIRWESSTDNFASSAFIFNNTVSHSYNNIFQTTKYRVVVRAGVCPDQYSNVVTILVSIPTILANDTAYTKMNKNYEKGMSVLTNDMVSPLLKLQSIVSGTTLRGGTLSMDSTGYFTYQPPKDFTGIDQIQYFICDASTMSSCLGGEIIIVVGDTVVVYTSLTPNGDGINDTWVIDGIHLYPKNNIKIFNRWGDLVYEMNNYNNYEKAWKGEANSGLVLGGKELPEGTYFYSIELGDGNKPKSGYVVIKH